MILALIGVVTMGSFATVAAQEATPEAAPSSASGEPAVGDTVTYIGDDDREWGTITVNQIVDPFEDYDPDYGAPDRGYRYIAVEITVEATGSRDLEVQQYDLLLQDDQGFLYGYAYITLTDDQAEKTPELEDTTLAAGDSVTGWVFFQAVNSAQLSHIFWQPDSGRLLTLAKVD
jgi:hypothetical protein